MTLHHPGEPSRAVGGIRRAVRVVDAARLARAEGRDPRLLVIILRGALDGLGAVAPVGDPDWDWLRGERALVLDARRPLCRSILSSR